MYHEKKVYQELPNVVDEMISYCSRPENNFNESFRDVVGPFSQNLTFEELRLANITSLQLLSWSISINVAERYQFYLNELNPWLNEHMYNCTAPWFGVRCQYSFAFGESMSFKQIVKAAFHGRKAYSEMSDVRVKVPCYVLLECHRNGQLWCLDWREVCDGNIDCFDEGVDEEFCFDMEINECGENEYRCHNGLCIAHELWEEGKGDPDCLDRSDEVSGALYINSCFQDPTFRCEEHSCRALFGRTFPCGDGQCVSKFDKCSNGRHILLIDSMTVKGNLTDECWIAMVCLTKLAKQINGHLCETWLMDNSNYKFLEQCASFFQFPTIPVYSDHIRFFYENPHLRSNMSRFFIPDYICYDHQLCDADTSQLVHGNFTCIQNLELVLDLSMTKNHWFDMMLSIEEYFSRSCSVPHVIFHNKTKYNDHPSLYNCNNSLKFISTYRLMDGIEDCFWMDDENYANSCLLNHRYRVKCRNTNKCWSPILGSDACWWKHKPEEEEIPFQNFCDGIKQEFYSSDGQMYIDESECEDWLCDNIYARCDGFWGCRDGRDEDNCSQTICRNQTQACVSPLNYTVICLPKERVNDGIDDCLGASDEQQECRARYPPNEVSQRFRCLNDSSCLQPSQLCNKIPDCPFGDDEGQFCENQTFTCNKSSAHNRSQVEKVLCGLNEDENRRIKYFSVHTITNYPSSEKSLIDITDWPVERYPVINDNTSGVKNHLWPWYCNRGLVVSTYDENSNDSRACMCPPSYYGNLCQYQNQRISLTLQLSSIDRYATYVIVSMLIDDNDKRQEIDAYDQFVYIAKKSCSIKFNRYLLFSTRPKNFSKNYSVRIDAFEKNKLTYVGSWHLPIIFLFLPVNRLTTSLILSNHLIPSSSNCSSTCNNGVCVKYLNKEKSFCRCNHKWSGIQCNIPMNCETCSSNSVCMGSANNQTICVCPLNNFGPRCLFTSECPANACQNDGQCVPADVSTPENDYTCICLDRFFGRNCQYQKAELDVSLTGIYIPPYLVAYFFTLSNESEPIETIILRKLTLFQHIVTFHISVLYHMVIIQAIDKYYLAVLQQSPMTDISTPISSKQECISIKQLLNSTVLKMDQYRRIIFYHFLCRTRSKLTCFIDETFLCFCTNVRHANCMKFNRNRSFQCYPVNHCANEAQCLQDHPTCPSTKICLCPNCFFGNQCQFYAKGLGSTLDEILGYEFKRNTILSKQPLRIQVSAAVTMVIFVLGIVDGILSMMTFSRKNSQELGAGIYLLASSITSLLTMVLFTLKFWLLFLSHQYLSDQWPIFIANCRVIEPLLKMVLYLDNWFNACVAIERTVCVFQGISFNKTKSKRVAKCIILLLCVTIICLFIPQLLNLHVFDDKTEERTWCVVTYKPWLQKYSLTLIFVHYFAPLSINIFSAIFIIIITTRQRVTIHSRDGVRKTLKFKLEQYKHLLISPAIIVFLTLPHLIISIILDCNKSSHLFWFFLIGYFLSFIPATLIFIIFVIPSPLYKKEFTNLIKRIKQRLVHGN